MFRTRYNHANPISPSGDKSLTDQQYKDECDINLIYARYTKTGILPLRKSGISGDFSTIGDYQTCLDKVNAAKSEFEALPSSVRERFGNDPRSYVAFVLDPNNADELVKLGLAEKIEKKDSAVDVLKRIEEKVTSKEETPA